jgi:hypothetical protein
MASSDGYDPMPAQEGSQCRMRPCSSTSNPQASTSLSLVQTFSKTFQHSQLRGRKTQVKWETDHVDTSELPFKYENQVFQSSMEHTVLYSTLTLVS